MNKDIMNNILKLSGVLNSIEIKSLIPQLGALANQKLAQEQAAQKTSQQAQQQVQQNPAQQPAQPVAQTPAPAQQPAVVRASVDTGKYGVMRRIKLNVIESFDNSEHCDNKKELDNYHNKQNYKENGEHESGYKTPEKIKWHGKMVFLSDIEESPEWKKISPSMKKQIRDMGLLMNIPVKTRYYD